MRLFAVPPIVVIIALFVGVPMAHADTLRSGDAVARPDLVLASTTTTPVNLPTGDWLRIDARVHNAGSIATYGSSIAVSLSTDAVRDSSDRTLRSKGIKRMRTRAARIVTTWMQLPEAVTAGSYHLVTCVTSPRRVREISTTNNCLATGITITARGAVVQPGNARGPALTDVVTGGGGVTIVPPVDPQTIDVDGDGSTPAQGDCAPTDANVHPGAVDAPDAAGLDSNCDGIDGDRADAVFVAPTGSDSALGTLDAPKRTLATAVEWAAVSGKRAVYAAGGTYDVGEGLALRDGISIYGSFDPKFWQRPAADPTTLVGSPVAVVVHGVTDARLQELHLTATSALAAGTSTYGIRIVDASDITLEDVAVTAGSGSAGLSGTNGVSGASGSIGGNGAAGDCGAGFDTSRVGGFGGLLVGVTEGGVGGASDIPHGRDGDDGMGNPGSGGAGGIGTLTVNGVAANGTDGADGADGRSGAVPGHARANTAGDAWTPGDGSNGEAGNDGTSGGGGGGGGGMHVALPVPTYYVGGGGGGGGSHGAGATAGTGGSGGGGSFAVYVHDSKLTLLGATTFAAGDGGAGGSGGSYATGGSGGIGGGGGEASKCLFNGGHGGYGGFGGSGGASTAGAGGNGGPSVAVALAGSTVVGTPLSATYASGGAGGEAGAQPAPPELTLVQQLACLVAEPDAIRRPAYCTRVRPEAGSAGVTGEVVTL